MTDKQLRKLKKEDLLSILLTQSREIERLREELAVTRKKLRERELSIAKTGSLAEASLALFHVFENAQKAADLYVENVRIRAGKMSSRTSDDREERP